MIENCVAFEIHMRYFETCEVKVKLLSKTTLLCTFLHRKLKGDYNIFVD